MNRSPVVIQLWSHSGEHVQRKEEKRSKEAVSTLLLFSCIHPLLVILSFITLVYQYDTVSTVVKTQQFGFLLRERERERDC